jgi:2-dehydro-3-deoxyphosphogalactonate aldolase
MMREQLINSMLKHKVVVILRGIKPEETIQVCEILAKLRVRFMEIPLNTPNALECIKLAAEHFKNSDIYIGAGTVLTAKDVDAVNVAGGSYIISPNIDVEVIKRTRELGLVSIPGFATPTEAFTAIKAGADILKCFPCGTPENIAVLKSVIPLPVLAVGGINCENRDAFLNTSDGLGVGIGIYSPSMSIKEFRSSARVFMEGI